MSMSSKTSNALWVRPVSHRLFVTVSLVMITLFSLFYQQRWGTVTDTSWLITVCERILAGEKLYVDVFDTNPPFSVLLYMPPVALASAMGIQPEILVHAWTYMAVLAGLFLTVAVVRRAEFSEAANLPVLIPVVYALLVIMPGNVFSQREYIGMALFLPLLALIAWRAKGGGLPPLWMAILVGMSGSVLLLVKPYYALMVLLPLCFAMSRQRSLKPLFAAEMWTAGLICMFYLVAVLFWYPGFLRDVYPVVAETYAPINYMGKLLRTFALPYAVLIVFVWWLSRLRGMSEPVAVLVLASLGAFLCLVWQGKGFAYHAWPAYFCAAVALVFLLPRPGFSRYDIALTVAGGAVLVLAATPFRPVWAGGTDLVEEVRGAIQNPTVAQIGTDIAIGHPFTRLIGGRWVAADPSDWQGSTALILRERASSPQAAERLTQIAASYADRKRAELERLRPDILLIQTNDVLWKDIISDPEGLAPVLENYAVLAEAGRTRVLLRKGAVSR